MAQVVATDAVGARVLGSGFLVAPGVVLTTAHVLAGAAGVRVRLDVGRSSEIDIPATGWWADPDGPDATDLAFVTIPEGQTAGRDTEPARFGRIGGGTAVVPVTAWGFPRHKLRAGTGSGGEQEVFRDLDQVRAHAPVAANRRQGTLAVYLVDPPPASEHPWEGLSGAAVWAGDRIIGVIAEHHSSEGTGRLTARRIDRAYERLAQPGLGRLVAGLGLPSSAGDLQDVVPPEPARLLRSVYLAQVRNIAPGALVGRDEELAEWVEFCSGRESYAWWQGGPWAGKTALASWFVTHPPDGMDVVSFFVTARLAGQSDGSAFLGSMIEQVAALVPGSASGGSGAFGGSGSGVRVGTWLSVLEGAARLSTERGRRLAVVVDGLDEDQSGDTTGTGQASIASMLPRHPPDGCVIIVTSRRAPGLLADVPHDHPLRACVPRQLSNSPVAAGIRDLATQELRGLLSDEVGVQIVGYLSASGGGLTRNDLAALIAVPPYRLDSVLRGTHGRTLETRPQAPARSLGTGDFGSGLGEAGGDARVGGGTDTEESAYLLGHETLRDLAAEELGGELDRYQMGIREWIGGYAAQGWPASTPGYAVRGYPALLAATGDALRASALARDPRRHALLRQVTGNDTAAIGEIARARRLVSAQAEPDLHELVELLVYQDALSQPYHDFPARLPAVWAQLGYLDDAVALASSLPDPDQRIDALLMVAVATAVAGNPDQAEGLVGTISLLNARAIGLVALAYVAATSGDATRAARLSAAARVFLPDLDENSGADLLEYLDSLPGAEVGKGTGEPAADATSTLDTAQSLTTQQNGPDQEPDRADAEAGEVADVGARASRLARLAKNAAVAGDKAHALRLAADAVALVPDVTRPRSQAQVLRDAANALSLAGDPDGAQALALQITMPGYQAQALTALAENAIERGDSAGALRLAIGAQQAARSGIDPEYRDQALVYLAAVMAQAGDTDAAVNLAGAVANPRHKAQALTEIAARTGDAIRVPELVEQALTIVADEIDDSDALARALQGIAYAAAEIRVRKFGGTHRDFVEDSGATAESAVAEMAVLVTRNSAPEYGLQLAGAIPQPDRDKVLAGMAIAVADGLLLAVPEAIATRIEDDYQRSLALKELIVTIVRSDDPDRAMQLLDSIETHYQWSFYSEISEDAARSGDFDLAESIVARIKHESTRVEALGEVACIAARAGDEARAARLNDAADALLLIVPEDRRYPLDQLILAAGQAGNARRVLALMDGDREGWPSPQVGIDDALTKAIDAGQPDCAEELIRATMHLSDFEWAYYTGVDKADALARLAIWAARNGDPDRAARLADEAEEILAAVDTSTTWRGDDARQELAKVRAREGAGARALSLIQTTGWDKDRALGEAAVEAAGTVHSETANELLGAMADPKARADAQGKAAIAAAHAGSYAHAMSLARAAASRYTSQASVQSSLADALANIAMEACRNGDLDEAQSMALAIADADKRESALADIGLHAGEAGNLDAARRLFAYALSGERGDLDPQSLVFIAIKTDKTMTKLARVFPAAILDSRDAFLTVYDDTRPAYLRGNCSA